MAKKEKFRRDPRTGVYHMDVQVKGHRYRDSLGTKNKGEAAVKAAVFLKDIQMEMGDIDINSISLYEMLKKYSKDAQQKGRQPDTVQTENSYINVLKEFIPRDIPLSQFTLQTAKDFFAYVRDPARPSRRHKGTPMSPEGVNTYLKVFREIWKYAVDNRFAKENIFKQIEKAIAPKHRVRYYSQQEKEAIIKKYDEMFPKEAALIRLYFLTGMRRCEALHLLWRDVHYSADPKEQFIVIDKAKMGKWRIVPMNEAAATVLRMVKRAKPDSLGPFIGLGHPDTISHHFKEVLVALKIPVGKLHDTRKTFGTELARRNVNPYTIIKWLGQSNDKVLIDHYLGLDMESAEKLSGLTAPGIDPSTDGHDIDAQGLVLEALPAQDTPAPSTDDVPIDIKAEKTPGELALEKVAHQKELQRLSRLRNREQRRASEHARWERLKQEREEKRERERERRERDHEKILLQKKAYREKKKQLVAEVAAPST